MRPARAGAEARQLIVDLAAVRREVKRIDRLADVLDKLEKQIRRAVMQWAEERRR